MCRYEADADLSPRRVSIGAVYHVANILSHCGWLSSPGEPAVSSHSGEQRSGGSVWVNMNAYLRAESGDLPFISPASWYPHYAVLRSLGGAPMETFYAQRRDCYCLSMKTGSVILYEYFYFLRVDRTDLAPWVPRFRSQLRRQLMRTGYHIRSCTLCMSARPCRPVRHAPRPGYFDIFPPSIRSWSIPKRLTISPSGAPCSNHGGAICTNFHFK